jgi:H+/Cl- antiporter ClcA
VNINAGGPMFALSASDFVITLAGVIVVLGVLAFIVGLFTLAFKISSSEFSEISAHSAKIMSKGLTEDVTVLVNNASSLLESISQMTKTKAGVGMFLIIVSFILFFVAYYLVSRIP